MSPSFITDDVLKQKLKSVDTELHLNVTYILDTVDSSSTPDN